MDQPKPSAAADYLLQRHMVSLGWVDDEWKGWAASAFVLSVRGAWFIVTAGHILEDWNRYRTQGRPMHGACLIDFSSDDAMPIPFPLDDVPFGYVNAEGKDYGLIRLGLNASMLLANGGLIPFNEQATIVSPPQAADHYTLIGFPNQAKRFDFRQRDGSIDIRLRMLPHLLRLERVDGPPEGEASSSLFYARVTLGGRGGLTDIKGMSGGPVFAWALDKGGHLRYWAIGVQSSWWPESRIVAASYLAPLVQEIADTFDAMDTRDPQDEGPTGTVS